MLLVFALSPGPTSAAGQHVSTALSCCFAPSSCFFLIHTNTVTEQIENAVHTASFSATNIATHSATHTSAARSRYYTSPSFSLSLCHDSIICDMTDLYLTGFVHFDLTQHSAETFYLQVHKSCTHARTQVYSSLHFENLAHTAKF